MKNFTIKEKVNVTNVKTYTLWQFVSEQLAKVTTQGVHVTDLLVTNFTSGEYSIKSINCKLRNVKDINLFMKLVNVAYYSQLESANTSKIGELEKKKELSEKQEIELSNRREFKEEIGEITKLFTKEEILFCDTDVFLPCVVATISKDISVFDRLTTEANVTLATIVAKLQNEKPEKEIREALNSFTKGCLSPELENQVYSKYNYNANATLTKDVIKIYYKGRKLDNKGNVVKSYDTKGNRVRTEILLAILEDLQNKAVEQEKKA